MAESGPVFFSQTLEAAADLSGLQYHLVRFSAAGKVAQSTSSTDRQFAGVLYNKPQSGEFASVQRGGKQKVVAGASATVFKEFTTSSSGRAIEVSSGSNDLVMGRFLEAPGADGDIVTVEVYQTPYIWPGIAF